MQITRKSIVSGKERTLDIDITEDQLKRWENGEGLIQNIMPNITPDEREFILTGITNDEWDETFKEE